MRQTPNAEFLQDRRRQIAQGLQEAVRREVARRRALGLPIHVAENGKVVTLPPEQDAAEPRPE